jgi:hypothetical protein
MAVESPWANGADCLVMAADDNGTYHEDPWDSLNFRYANDELAQFELLFDAIEDIVAKLRSPNVADRRLALITADYAVDVLLARRVANVVALSERGAVFERRQRFDSRARGLLRQGFNRRVAVAAADYSGRFTLGAGEPIMSQSDADVLRVAHACRNDAYHADRHNENILPAIVAATLHAVARTWVRSLPSKTASSRGVDSPLMRRLDEKGYEAPEWAWPGMKMFSLYAGAKTVSRWLDQELPIGATAQRDVFAEDIAMRVAWANSMVVWLGGREGPGKDEIEPGLRWYDFWRQHGDDPELVELDEARADAYEAAMGAKSGELDAAARDAEAKYLAHFQKLMAEHRPVLSLEDLPRLGKLGAALRNAKGQGSLFVRYLKIDLELRVFEETFAELAIGWDRAVQAEEDRRSGK